MRISTQLRLGTILAVVLALVAVGALVITSGKVSEALKRSQAFEQIADNVMEVNHHIYDYVVYRSDKAIDQWESSNESLTKSLNSLEQPSRTSEALIGNLRELHAAIGSLLAQILRSEREVLSNASRDQPELNRWQRNIIDRLLMQSREMSDRARELHRKEKEQGLRYISEAAWLTGALVVTIAILFVAVGLVTTRNVARPIGILEQGAAELAKGNLDHRVRIRGRNEFGHLGASFNSMAGDLKKSYQALEEEIAKRKVAEAEVSNQRDEVRKQAALLKGINRVLLETLEGSTDEDVARVCLSVAKELTGSSFGWIGELNESGWLHVIASTDPSAEACTKPKSESCRAIRDMELRGICASVWETGDFRIVNDPSSHSDSLGFPEGHPKLDSFICVPLKHLESTIGLIALGNKNGGYDREDSGLLEQLSVPFVEGLYLKLAEEQIRERQDQLEKLVQERSTELQRANATLHREIQEREAAQESLRKEQEFADATIDSLPGILYVFDELGRFLRWNSNFETVTGYSAEEIAQLHPLDLFLDDDKRRIAEAIQRAFETGQAIVEAGLVSKDGSRFPYLFTGRRVLLDDKTCIVGVAMDIADRKRAEAALRKKSHDLGERVKEMTCLLRISRLVETSPSLEDILRWTVDLIPGGWQFPEITCVRISVREREIVSDTRGVPSATIAEEIFCHGSCVGFIEVGYVEERPTADEGPFLKEERDLLQAIALKLSLVIERNEAEIALKQHTDALERANAELEQFTYISSHHLQEPLRKVINYSELLERRYKGQMDDRADRYIHYVVDGATRMRSLIEALLNLTRLDKLPPSRKPTSLEAILQEALRNLETRLQASEADVNWDFLPTLEVDEDEIRLLFRQLVSNAIKYRGTNKPIVHVSAKQCDDHWLLSVSDNGIGIASDYTERIFEVFQRLHSPEDYPGTGIGLALCKKIVERHGGRIWVESEPGRGSTFSFAIS